LGWEPQWLLIKQSSTSGANWMLFDTMRGLSQSTDALLYANLANSEFTSNDYLTPTATGFELKSSNYEINQSSQTYIYIAIRRGPMKTPTDATKVFTSALATVSSLQTTWTTNFPVDLALFRLTAFTQSVGFFAHDRLRGAGVYDFGTATTAAESTGATVVEFDRQTTFLEKYGNTNGRSVILEAFRRAPGFFDVVAYTGTFTTSRAISHNLGVTPELMIIKQRSTTRNWIVYSAGVSAPATSILYLNTTAAVITGITTHWSSTAPTSTSFTVGNDNDVNQNAGTYIAYLFATCPGVSKCFNFTGNGTSQTINCGFTAGAKFVLIKRTDSTGNWLVADTARGIVSGNDPLLYLNSTAAEVTTLDWIDPDNSGFVVNQEATANANVNGATYIGLAIA
jgi:hypothetical protein